MKYSIGAAIVVSNEELNGYEIRKRSKYIEAKTSDEYEKMCNEINDEFNSKIKQTLARVIAKNIVDNYNDLPFDISELDIGLDRQFTTKISIEC